MEDLETTDKSSIVNAINEVNSKQQYFYEVQEQTNSVEIPVFLKVGEKWKIEIVGGTTGNTDVFFYVNDIVGGYYQAGVYFGGNLTSEGSLELISGYRPNKDRFYFVHSMRNTLSTIEGVLDFKKSVSAGGYYVSYKWNAYATLDGNQLYSQANGWLYQQLTEVTKLKFTTENNSNIYFRAGTTFKITRMKDEE